MQKTTEFKRVKSLFGEYEHIPVEWEIKTFGELFEFLRSGSNSRDELEPSGEIQYIHYGDIHMKWHYTLDCDSEEIPWIGKDKVKGLPFLNDGDLVIADASEDYEGSAASILLKNVKNRKIVSGLHTIPLRNSNELVFPEFKTYLNSIKFVKKQIVSYVTGISVYGLSKNNLKNIRIPLPTLKEQQKITSIISEADELIRKTDQIIERNRRLKKGLMQKLLTKGIGHSKFKKVPFVFKNTIEIPYEWKVDYLSNNLAFLGGFAFSSSNYQTQGMQLLRQGNLFDKSLRLDKEPVYLPSEFYTEYKRFVLKPEDIVISLTGTMGKRDYGFVVKIPLGSPPLLLNQRIAKVILLSESQMDKDFLVLMMNSLYFQEQFYRLEGGTKQANISLDKISRIRIFIPEMKEQREIVSTLSHIDLAIENNVKCRKNLGILKKGLMQKLLTGRIRVKV